MAPSFPGASALTAASRALSEVGCPYRHTGRSFPVTESYPPRVHLTPDTLLVIVTGDPCLLLCTVSAGFHCGSVEVSVEH